MSKFNSNINDILTTAHFTVPYESLYTLVPWLVCSKYLSKIQGAH